MLIDIHTHNNKTAEGIFAIRSFSILDSDIDTSHPFSIGLHPWHYPIDKWLEKLEHQTLNPQCIMIGECGIDHLKGPNTALQTECFVQQAHLAERIGKPLVIHAVRSHSEILHLHDAIKPQQAWIMHGFRGSMPMLQQLLRRGIFISMGTIITTPNGQELLKRIPPQKLFLETDESKQTISDLYQCAASALHIPQDALAEIIQGNCEQLLGSFAN